jgi:DNA-binding Lrp family transcriptional regulator
MDPYDKEILNALKDGTLRNFQQIFDEIGFSHNTLRLHLNYMVDRGHARVSPSE